MTDSESNTLHAEVWGKAAVKLNSIIIVGHCYILQNWSYKAAIKSIWTRSTHKFVLKLNEQFGNAIEFDGQDFPHELFHPLKFKDIEVLEDNAVVDIVGIVIQYADPNDYANTLRNRLTLLDNLGHQCIIYTKNIEEELAATTITVKQTIIGFKGVQKLSSGLQSFDARCFPDTTIQIKPICKMTEILQGWYEKCTRKTKS